MLLGDSLVNCCTGWRLRSPKFDLQIPGPPLLSRVIPPVTRIQHFVEVVYIPLEGHDYTRGLRLSISSLVLRVPGRTMANSGRFVLPPYHHLPLPLGIRWRLGPKPI